jgi:hypothetical protein
MTRAFVYAALRRLPAGRLACALSASLLLSLPATAHAQSWRLQGAWVPHRVLGPLIGLEGRQPLGAPPPLPGAGAGPVEAGTRSWILTAMVGVGVNLIDVRSTVTPIFYAHAGVIYRTGSDLLSRAGLVGVGYVRARAVGPEVFLELAGVADVQAGVLHVPGGWKPGVGLTVSLSFLRDLLG